MHHPEVQAMFDLLARLVMDGRTGVLLALLAIAAIIDYRTRRIPNWLVLGGAIYGLVYTVVFPPIMHGNALFPLGGFIVGFGLFLPLYLMRALGAGDVKLFAMVGTFLGPLDTFYSALATGITGGALTVLWAVWHGKALRVVQNIAGLIQFGPLSAVAGAPAGLRIASGGALGKLPYGVAIALGTGGYLTFHQLGFV